MGELPDTLALSTAPSRIFGVKKHDFGVDKHALGCFWTYILDNFAPQSPFLCTKSAILALKMPILHLKVPFLCPKVLN